METQIQCAKGLVCYGPDDIVEGVLEFQVARVLLAGRVDLLSCKVPSQWGEVTLIDLCLTFGHYDTAWALAEGGVQGCRVEAYHLRPQGWSAANDGLTITSVEPRFCSCQGWSSCKHCCFGFDVEQGVWMQDWNASLESAMEAAKPIARKPFAARALNCLKSGSGLPFAVSEEAMAKLLDLAILTGDTDLAARVSDLWQVRPLRWWRVHELFGEENGTLIILRVPGVLLAALAAGIDLTELWWQGLHAELPFREAVALSGRWSDFAKLLPRTAIPWVPPPQNLLAPYLLRPAHRDPHKSKLCAERLQEAMAAGVALKDFRWRRRSLLDWAILCGQPDCARLCAAAGVEMLEVTAEQLKPDVCVNLNLAIGPCSERRAAAAAAAREALTMNWRRQCEKGVAIFQVMKACLRGRPFPAILVDEVLAYAMAVPRIVQKLDLWDEVQDWHTSMKRRSSNSAGTSHPEVPVDPEAPTEPEPPASAHDVPVEGPAAEAPEADRSKEDGDAPDDLLRAIQESRAEAPALFNRDGVRLYSLTRMVKAKHVVDLLFDPDGPLKALHDRVKDFGCEVDPAENPVKILFVPCTPEQINELQQLAVECGLELRRDRHLLALEADAPLIDAALRSFPKAPGPR